jgi:endogenous inhibitor of DNA gyrase (YacG/DUF329 family)
MITLTCPGCGKPLRVKDEFAGKRVKCPGCGAPVPIPAQAATASLWIERCSVSTRVYTSAAR